MSSLTEVVSPMQFKSSLVALAATLSFGAAHALDVVNVGAFTLSYDETSDLGHVAGWYSAAGWQGFEWTVPAAVQTSLVGGGATQTVFTLPSFTLSANAGWQLTGDIGGFIGNLVYNLVGAGASVSAEVEGNLSVDGGPAVAVGGLLTQTSTAGVPGVFEVGYLSGSQTANVGAFTTLSFTGGLLKLNASGGSFAAITAQPQNLMKIDVAVAEVPEPASMALMLAGLGALGSVYRRRTQR